MDLAAGVGGESGESDGLRSIEESTVVDSVFGDDGPNELNGSIRADGVAATTR